MRLKLSHYKKIVQLRHREADDRKVARSLASYTIDFETATHAVEPDKVSSKKITCVHYRKIIPCHLLYLFQ